MEVVVEIFNIQVKGQILLAKSFPKEFAVQ
jgi:hypothetical protein